MKNKKDEKSESGERAIVLKKNEAALIISQEKAEADITSILIKTASPESYNSDNIMAVKITCALLKLLQDDKDFMKEVLQWFDDKYNVKNTTIH